MLLDSTATPLGGEAPAAQPKLTRKAAGAYYTPDPVVETLVRWAVRSPTDRMLDPSCGDGRFIARHRHSVGCEQDADAVREARRRAPHAEVHHADLFTWAARAEMRFDCAVGNPPFIRYQTFSGDRRRNALRLCRALGVELSSLTSSWAPFLVATASLLKRGGRMAFVVPAEIGHAPYAAPLLDHLVASFATVQVLACREKLFPELSEDCWLLYADGFGGSTDEIRFAAADRFEAVPHPPASFQAITVREWRQDWNRRLRPFLIAPAARDVYRQAATDPGNVRLGDLATVGIGYVTGANDFFHLRPSEARRWSIPDDFLMPTVRNGRVLPADAVTGTTVEAWHRRDDPMLLLNIPRAAELPAAVRRYLGTAAATAARQAYKCRMRDPWYSVPDVQTPAFFLAYMAGTAPRLVRNEAGCTCTNSVHAVRLKPTTGRNVDLPSLWRSPLARLSCELEGHPLGGGMLKLEPREAGRVMLPGSDWWAAADISLIAAATAKLRQWRHCGNGN